MMDNDDSTSQEFVPIEIAINQDSTIYLSKVT